MAMIKSRIMDQNIRFAYIPEMSDIFQKMKNRSFLST